MGGIYISFQMLTASFSARQLEAWLTFGSSSSLGEVSRAWRTIDTSGGGGEVTGGNAKKKKKSLGGFWASRRLLQKSEEEADATTSSATPRITQLNGSATTMGKK